MQGFGGRNSKVMGKTVILGVTFAYLRTLQPEVNDRFMKSLEDAGIKELRQRTTKSNTVYFVEVK